MKCDPVEGGRTIAELAQKNIISVDQQSTESTFLFKLECLDDSTVSYAFYSGGFSSRRLTGGDLKDGLYHLEVYTLSEHNDADDREELERQTEAWEKCVATILRQSVVNKAQNESLRCALEPNGSLRVGSFSKLTEDDLVQTLVDALELSKDAALSYVESFIDDYSNRQQRDDVEDGKIANSFFKEIIVEAESQAKESVAKIERYSGEQMKILQKKLMGLESELEEKRDLVEQMQEFAKKAEADSRDRIERLRDKVTRLEKEMEEKQEEVEKSAARSRDLMEKVYGYEEKVERLERDVLEKQLDIDSLDAKVRDSIDKLKRDSAEQIQALEDSLFKMGKRR